MFSTVLSRCTVAAAHYTKNITPLRHFSSEIDFADLVKRNKVVVFMKGDPDAPRCGFSRGAVLILKAHGVEFDYHDVLTSRDLREGIKKFSDWPTIPQIFINSEFVGGFDILKSMHRSGELIAKLKEAGITSTYVDEDEEQSKKQ